MRKFTLKFFMFKLSLPPIFGKTFWRTIPYISLAITAGVFFYLSYFISNQLWNNWFLSISSNIASIFFAFFLYELIKARSQKELNKEVFEYAKRIVDRDIYSILHTLSKFLYGFERGRVWSQTSLLLKMSPSELETLIQHRKFAGFELFKSWDEIYEYFSRILENNFVLTRLNDEQILIVLEMRNTLASIKRSFETRENFTLGSQKVANFSVAKGTDINSENTRYPNRFILLRNKGKGEHVVEDFGDFAPSDVDKLLNVYTLKPEASGTMAMWTYLMLRNIKRWLETTGGHLYLPMK